MKVATLRLLWQELNDLFFGGTLIEVPIRLTRSERLYGYFAHTQNSGSSVIRISGRLNKTLDDFRDTMLHEMVHQYLFEQHGNLDQEHGPHFLEQAQRVGIKT